MSLPNFKIIENSKKTPWDFGNGVLYELCEQNFYHNDIEKIISKVWLIGRAYSAAIERRPNKTMDNDSFYINKVAPQLKNSEIDSYLEKLRNYENLTSNNIQEIIKTHKYLINTIAEITNLEKRSFCSKYLHFHLPNLFFIYDSRAVNTLKVFINKVPESMKYIIESDFIDKEYGKFVCKCFFLKNSIEEKYNIDLTLRQFDNILLNYTNNNRSVGNTH